MKDKELIEKIQLLRQIKPNNDWAFSVKNEILNKEFSSKERFNFRGVLNIWEDLNFVFNHKYAFAFLIVLLTTVGTFGFSVNSTPGDTLFIFKKAMEQSQGAFVSGLEKQKFELGQANRRLEDLARIAADKDTRKLAPAIDEYKATVSEVTKNLAREQDENRIKELIAEVKKLEDREKEIKSLGVEIGENVDKDIVLVILITNEVEKIEVKDLTSEQQALLAEIKDDCEKGNFVNALEKILVINSGSVEQVSDEVPENAENIEVEEEHN